MQLVTQQPLTAQQVRALVAEVATESERPAITSGARIDLRYEVSGRVYIFAQDESCEHLRIVVRLADEVRTSWAESAAPRAEAASLAARSAGDVATVAQRTETASELTNGSHPHGTSGAVQSATATIDEAMPATESLPVKTMTNGDVPLVQWRLRVEDRTVGPFASELEARSEMERLLRLQVERKAADLHLRIGEPPIMRSGGDLTRLTDESVLDEGRLTAMLLSIMPDKNRDEFDATWDTDFAHEIAGLCRFRINALKDRNGPAAVMRTIASNTVTVEQMGITPEVQQLCNLTKGLVLVTGPTGSGKSTTLCALIDLVNRTRKDHIITIEDPIEFVHQSKQCLITQRQVGVHTQSFKSALRAALREDPDIIMVGELRDLETIAIALETAETGHLVFGTLHTSTAASTINRIVDQFPADRQDQIKVMLAESLKGVISQTLCKKVGGGRVAAREILLVNKAVSALIRESKTVQINNIIQTQRKLGMETLNDALLTLVKNGSVEAKEAYVKSVEKKDMALKLRALGHDMSAYTSEE